ncbi:hypothetical protein [Actinoallomurus sp. NPDC052274]|uniref:hypothetical protein n=1 Tax=Actinoallomurus sp. NPDC052274 TaxID=3155420 RepID=UPI00342EB02D
MATGATTLGRREGQRLRDPRRHRDEDPADGFQTHRIVEGWGTGTIFRGNKIDLAGGDGGTNDTAGGNTILCDNEVSDGRLTEDGTCVNK